MWRVFLCLVFAGFGLAGCGGGAASDPPPMSQVAFSGVIDNDNATILRIAGNIDEGLLGIPGTNWSSVPVAGDALFIGLGYGEIGDMTFRGDALVTVDFGADDIRGGLRNIVGGNADRTYATDGIVVFSNGDVRATRPNDFTVDYAGTLEFGEDSYVLDGTMTGLLRGTRVGVSERSPIKALSAADTAGTAMVNGEAVDMNIMIVGETR